MKKIPQMMQTLSKLTKHANEGNHASEANDKNHANDAKI